MVRQPKPGKPCRGFVLKWGTVWGFARWTPSRPCGWWISLCRNGMKRAPAGMPCINLLLLRFTKMHIYWKANLVRFAQMHTTRSEEHTSELQSRMRNSYAIFCLKKNIQITHDNMIP